MYARSSTIHADPGSIDAGIAHLRDVVLPELQTIDGFNGLSLIVDRDSGDCIATASWATQEAMRANADRVSPIRQRAAGLMGGETVQVDEWEVAVMHRTQPTHEGACVRATWTRSDPSRVDAALDVYKHSVLPATEAMGGFCSASMMVDRASGRSVGTTTWENRAALEASRVQADDIRANATTEAGVEITGVREFELALAHLHVPELV